MLHVANPASTKLAGVEMEVIVNAIVNEVALWLDSEVCKRNPKFEKYDCDDRLVNTFIALEVVGLTKLVGGKEGVYTWPGLAKLLTAIDCADSDVPNRTFFSNGAFLPRSVRTKYLEECANVLAFREEDYVPLVSPVFIQIRTGMLKVTGWTSDGRLTLRPTAKATASSDLNPKDELVSGIGVLERGALLIQRGGEIVAGEVVQPAIAATVSSKRPTFLVHPAMFELALWIDASACSCDHHFRKVDKEYRVFAILHAMYSHGIVEETDEEIPKWLPRGKIALSYKSPDEYCDWFRPLSLADEPGFKMKLFRRFNETLAFLIKDEMSLVWCLEILRDHFKNISEGNLLLVGQTDDGRMISEVTPKGRKELKLKSGQIVYNITLQSGAEYRKTDRFFLAEHNLTH